MESTEKDKKLDDMKSQLMVFALGADEYAFRLSELQEVINLPIITSIPGTADFIRGIFNLRGKIIVALDLKKRFAIESEEKDQAKHAIVISVAAGAYGAIVDKVMGIIFIADSVIQNNPKGLKINSEFVEGVVVIDGPVARKVILLNIGNLFSGSDLDLLR